jgi:hypothetical protein
LCNFISFSGVAPLIFSLESFNSALVDSVARSAESSKILPLYRQALLERGRSLCLLINTLSSFDTSPIVC